MRSIEEKFEQPKINSQNVGDQSNLQNQGIYSNQHQIPMQGQPSNESLYSNIGSQSIRSEDNLSEIDRQLREPSPSMPPAKKMKIVSRKSRGIRDGKTKHVMLENNPILSSQESTQSEISRSSSIASVSSTIGLGPGGKNFETCQICNTSIK